MTQIWQLLRTGSLTIAWLLVLPCIVLLLSAIVPIVPWVRIYASGVVPNHVPWLLLLSIAVLVVGLLAHSRRRTGMTRYLIAVASVAALAAAWVMSHLLYVAISNGARIDLLKTMSLREYSESAGPDETRIYARPQGEALSLDIYHARRTSPKALSPVLLVVHGGGFVEGSRSTGAANMRGYANRGWTVISIDYRLARPDRPTWNLAIADVRCALAWTGANAATLGLDLKRLTISGASAGGSLAIAAAYESGAKNPDPSCGPTIPRVAAVVVKAPLIDVVGSWQHAGELQDQQRRYLTQYIGGPPEQYPERYAAVDLRRHIRPQNPPTLILCGTNDPLLPVAAAKDFARRAEAAGSQVQLVMFPYSGHDFNTTFGGIANQAVVQIVSQFTIDHKVGPQAPSAAAP